MLLWTSPIARTVYPILAIPSMILMQSTNGRNGILLLRLLGALARLISAKKISFGTTLANLQQRQGHNTPKIQPTQETTQRAISWILLNRRRHQYQLLHSDRTQRLIRSNRLQLQCLHEHHLSKQYSRPADHISIDQRSHI
jgi:hypothetical protein